MEHSSLKPAKIVAGSFVGGLILGALLLKLPIASVSGTMSWIDAFFMSTSAICVTGLAVIDIGTQLTLFGQCVILGLIQIGGLGIMTLSLFFMMLIRRKTSLVSRLAVGFSSHKNAMQDLLHTILSILLLTIVFEALGAGLLFLRFREIYPPGEALYYAIFHAVSAFCNAGFGLYPDSLMRFRHEWFLPCVIMFLVISGGLGFMVIDEIRNFIFHPKTGTKMSLHSRICIVGTLVLIFLGALVLWLLEYDNTLKGMSGLEQAVNAFFLSITPRTAGFNMLDTGHLTNASLFFTLIFMFIGGCPGSAAGGVKVSTAAILAAIIKSHIKGAASPSILERKISSQVIARALSVFASAFIIIAFAVFFLQITEKKLLVDLSVHRNFLSLLFEAVSAFGTVGLSTGITGSLSGAGKIIIIILMYAGRIGPLTLGLAIITQKKRTTRYEYVEEEVIVS